MLITREGWKFNCIQHFYSQFFSYEPNFSFTGLDSVELRSTLVLLHGKCLIFNELPT